ncbi:MAG: alpha/beta hydrolase [Novosphingobium sp.]|nr:alpha/beta hydrolase [Novosphingobium sp.]
MTKQPGSRHPIAKPPLVLTMLEPLRFGLGVSTLFAASGLLAAAPRGDSHPVMVLPGFATSDAMTGLLRSFLLQLGYRVYPWELGWNFDQHSAGANGEHIARRIAQIAADCGEDVSLVGWSLGGVLAREAARRDRGGIRQVIALGSPFTGNPEATSLSLLYDLLTGNKTRSEASSRRYAVGHHPIDVPATAVYSHSDGITAWENCCGLEGPQTENIAVVVSHFCFVASPAVFWAVADRLAQPAGEWRPFERGGPFAAFFEA